MIHYDLIVIGAGSGLEVSATAAESGMSVAVVEQGPFGGTCLNRGCIPSKMLIHCADVMETIRSAEHFGIRARVEAVDWGAIIRRASDEIDREAREVEEGNRAASNISVYKDTARFVGEKVLQVGGEQITAPTIVIAAGTRPSVPQLDGLVDVPYITSDEALRIPTQPRRLTIVGGGYIAAELAHFFGALGTEVTIVYRGHVLLRNEDEQVAQRFTDVYRRKFRLMLDTQLSKVRHAGDGIALEVVKDQQRQEVLGDALLFATGRVPNTDILDVGQTGVRVDETGFVETDEYLETNVPGIWALGDIVGKYLLKHSANLEAAYVAHNMLNPDGRIPIDYTAMPHAIFASPQIGSVGVTEQDARTNGIAHVAATYDFKDTAYGSSIQDDDGFVKVLADPHTDEILGCHIIGTEASILVQEVVNAMRAGLTTAAITQSIYIHPALPEVVQRAFGALRHRG